MSLPVSEQCANVRESCPEPHTFFSIPYVQRYFCASTVARPFHFAGYVVWLLFIFSTLGISASDFFCPNLATLSQILGLDENVAGVTFLAFGNGSPDVFTTFSAMRSDSGGMALGELLGAASFITSCVVGSMCIIKPFKVDRAPFLRDVGFFTLAVIVILFVLWDSELEMWESVSLVVLYVVYVIVVIAGSWWERRRQRKRRIAEMMRDEYREEDIPQIVEPYRDNRKSLYSVIPSPNPNMTQLAQLPPLHKHCRYLSLAVGRHLHQALPVWASSFPCAHGRVTRRHIRRSTRPTIPPRTLTTCRHSRS